MNKIYCSKTIINPTVSLQSRFRIKLDSIASISQEILIRNEKRDVSTKGAFTMHTAYTVYDTYTFNNLN